MPTCQIIMQGPKSRVVLVGSSTAANDGNELTGAQAEPTTKWQKCIDVTYLGNEISIANQVSHSEQQPDFSFPPHPFLISLSPISFIRDAERDLCVAQDT